MENKLTVQQAKEQGYTHFGYSDEGYQAMTDLVDFRADEATGKEYLFNKDPEPPYSVTPDYIKDLIVDRISDQWDSDTRDDTGEMEDFLKDIPLEKFEEITNVINDATANKHYYKLSDIKLLP